MDFQRVTDTFAEDLKQSDLGEKTSFSYIHNPLPENHVAHDGETYQVIVIGGSTYRKADVVRNAKQVQMHKISKGDLPVFHTKESFLSFLEDHVEKHVSKLAINFAYPLDPVNTEGVLDAKLIKGTKENTFEGLVGQQVGLEIAKHFRQLREQELVVSVANDTVCLLLSGLSVGKPETLAGGVVGTGFNFAFFAKPDDIINLESGGFNNFELTESGKYVDEHSKTPGHQFLEKEVAGAYLFQHYNYMVEKIHSGKLTSTKDMNEVAKKGPTENSKIARQLFTRSADFIGAAAAGIMKFKDTDLTFIIQGSLFWKGWGYRERVYETAVKLSGFTPTFLEISDADILGAANLL